MGFNSGFKGLNWAHTDNKYSMLPLQQPARFLRLSTTQFLNLTQTLAVQSQQTNIWCCYLTSQSICTVDPEPVWL